MPQSVIVKILGKMFERSPILCSFVRFATVIDPAVILTLDKRALQNRMKGLLNELLSAKILSASDCEEAPVTRKQAIYVASIKDTVT